MRKIEIGLVPPLRGGVFWVIEGAEQGFNTQYIMHMVAAAVQHEL